MVASPMRECELADWLHAPETAIRDSADIVIDGTVVGFDEPSPQLHGTVQLEVRRSWREQTQRRVSFLYYEECGPRLEIGDAHIFGVFRYGDESWVLAALPDSQAAPLIAALAPSQVFVPYAPSAPVRYGVAVIGFVAIAIVVAVVIRISTRHARID
jgi:hypothetical protein